jgi:hypothetical protein
MVENSSSGLPPLLLMRQVTAAVEDSEDEAGLYSPTPG